MAANCFFRPDEVPTMKVIQGSRNPSVYLPYRTDLKRLPGIDYSSADEFFFVSFGIRKKIPDEKLFMTVLEASILKALHEFGFTLFVYTCMPDHGHMLLSPSGRGESLSLIIKRVKDAATKRLKYDFIINLDWRRGFHDHVLRPWERMDDVFASIVFYIAENPVRKNLVAQANLWKFAGRPRY